LKELDALARKTFSLIMDQESATTLHFYYCENTSHDKLYLAEDKDLEHALSIAGASTKIIKIFIRDSTASDAYPMQEHHLIQGPALVLNQAFGRKGELTYNQQVMLMQYLQQQELRNNPINGGILPLPPLPGTKKESSIYVSKDGAQIEKYIVRDGFQYVLSWRVRNELYYRCEEYKKLKCRGCWKIQIGNTENLNGTLYKKHTVATNQHSFAQKPEHSSTNKSAAARSAVDYQSEINSIRPMLAKSLSSNP